MRGAAGAAALRVSALGIEAEFAKPLMRFSELERIARPRQRRGNALPSKGGELFPWKSKPLPLA
jgi:hypothetical protein